MNCAALLGGVVLKVFHFKTSNFCVFVCWLLWLLLKIFQNENLWINKHCKSCTLSGIFIALQCYSDGALRGLFVLDTLENYKTHDTGSSETRRSRRGL